MSASQTVVREVKDKTGFDAEVTDLVGVHTNEGPRSLVGRLGAMAASNER